MTGSRSIPLLVLLAVIAGSMTHPARPASAADGAPRVYLDKSRRIVDYQLKRLDNDELLQVERKTDDPRYIPVYEAILARPGLPQTAYLEAVNALATLNGTDLVTEAVAAIARLGAESDSRLVGALAAFLVKEAHAGESGAPWRSRRCCWAGHPSTGPGRSRRKVKAAAPP